MKDQIKDALIQKGIKLGLYDFQCHSCCKGKKNHYALGIEKEWEGETVYVQKYSICEDCLKSSNKEAWTNTGFDRIIPAKYYSDVLSTLVRKESSKHTHILIKSEDGRRELKRA